MRVVTRPSVPASISRLLSSPVSGSKCVVMNSGGGGAGGASWNWTLHNTRVTSSRMATSIRSNRRSEEHTSELQSLMRISYAVFCLKKKNTTSTTTQTNSLQITSTHQLD